MKEEWVKKKKKERKGVGFFWMDVFIRLAFGGWGRME